MKTRSDEIVAESRARLERRLEILGAFADLPEGFEDDPGLSEAGRRVLWDYGSPYEYGIEFSRYTTNHYDDTVTYSWILCTGGPHEEFHLTYADGVLDRASWIYRDWDGYDEIEIYGADFDGWAAPLARFAERYLSPPGKYTND